ncbi:Macrophage mannose receptor 1 [Hypsibius exemplaris]|uniref:Macrophage mannose receptor 1 n=1 Tax=Hypsibius exemplaris TaxID=2072580 RepID=A0A1W0X785_HYPEX|nr:Macrophage mannose receptor 1 [Hypsibius exemplaris]
MIPLVVITLVAALSGLNIEMIFARRGGGGGRLSLFNGLNYMPSYYRPLRLEQQSFAPPINFTCGFGNDGAWYYDSSTDTCFFYSSTTATWPEAERRCLAINSHLATIEQRNNDFVRRIIRTSQPYGRTLAWIGLRLSHLPTNTHSWVNGNLVNMYRPWDENEPNPQGTEGCVVMNSDNGRFRDAPCQLAEPLRFVCRKVKPTEAPANSTAVAPKVEDHWGCPIDRPDLVRFGSFCYWFSPPNELKNWTEALKACQDLYHHPNDTSKSSSLVSIHSEIENELVLSYMQPRVHRWTGLREDQTEQALYWTDQTSLTFLNWHYGEPRREGPQCVWMYGDLGRAGLWDDAVCDYKAGYICKMQKEQTKSAPPQSNYCPTGFYSKNGTCFGILPMNDSHLPEEICERAGVGIRPASIITPMENAFVHVLIHGIRNNNSTANATAWLGGKESRGSVKWDNGCFLKFNNIQDVDTATVRQNDTCIVMDHDGKWRKLSCKSDPQTVPYVVCEKRDGAQECDKAEPASSEGTCPVGFPEECGDFCYRIDGASSTTPTLIRSKTSWEGAKTACANMGASLATVRNEKDQNCLQQYASRAEQGVWIGLYYEPTSYYPALAGKWKWLDPAFEFEQNYVNWKPGQPDNMGQSYYRELCGEMLNGGWDASEAGLWNNRPCMDGHRQGYICERLRSPENNASCGFSKTGDWFYDAKTDSCFFVSRTFASWPNAELTCNSMDAHLATIERDNHLFLRQILTRDYPTDTNFWIGLRLKNVHTMTHSWVDGDAANIFRVWDYNEPNNEATKACVVMNNGQGKWRDFRCQWSFRFVCRKPKIPVILVKPPVVNESWGCPAACKDCLRFGSSCYWFSPANERKNWGDALKSCQQLYAHPTDLAKSSSLVSIQSDLEQDFLLAHMGADRSNRWTGLHEEHDQKTLYWTDHSYFGYSNWNYREPSDTSANTQDCVIIYGDVAKAGRWNDQPCGSTAGYICKMQKDQTAPAPVPSNNCSAGFEYLNGVCFGIFPTATDARATCSNEGGSQFATITNPYENAFVRVLLNKATNTTDPVTDVDKAQAWLGGVDNKGKLTWTSGCFPKINNIVNFYTSNQEGNCVTINRDGKWNSRPCSDTVQFVACEQRTVECEKLIANVTGTCPVRFPDEGNDFCYYVAHTTATVFGECFKATWSEAKDACAEMGGSVLTIRSEADQQLLEKYIERSTSALWLGLYEEVDPLTSIGTWRWIDDNATYQGNYQNWEQGSEPENATPSVTGYTRESCTEIKPSGKWGRVQCDQGVTRGYICEKLKEPTSTATTWTKSSALIGLRGGSIAGIVSAVLLLVFVTAIAAFLIARRRRSGGVFLAFSRSRSRDSDTVAVINSDEESFTL